VIHYLVMREHAYTMATFLQSWGKALAERVRIVTYDEVLAGVKLPRRDATYIFSDLDRLSAASRPVLGALCDQIVAHCGQQRVFNHPVRSLLRYPLLRELHRRGINRFDAWRPGVETPLRFPVFLRGEGERPAEIPPLLKSPAEYEAAIARPPADALAVEFVDTADASGVYRKYGAFVVGERILPRHIFFSLDWMVTMPDLAAPAMVAEERAYLDANPHEAALREAARAANIEYGRIDYSVLDGRPQIWEINTNPMIASDISAMHPQRRATHELFVAMLAEAFAGFDRR
jgi:hypothetical protein